MARVTLQLKQVFVEETVTGGKGGNATSFWDWINTECRTVLEVCTPIRHKSIVGSSDERIKILKRRFDHFFASNKFKVLSAKYLHNQKKISDHSPMLVEYKL